MPRRKRGYGGQRELVNELGKHSSKQLQAERVRAEALKAKLERGEDISPEDEAWLLKLDPSGQAVADIKEATTPFVDLKADGSGAILGYENKEKGFTGENSGANMVELTPTKRMLAHTDIVDENGNAIISEGPDLRPLNGHALGDALLALEMRNQFRANGVLTEALAADMDRLGWQTRIPITSSDMREMEKTRKLQRYRQGATLADEIRDRPLTTRPLPKQLGNKLRDALIGAHKFVLTAQAAETIGQAIRSYPEMLVKNGQFALPPFPKTWIEMPTLALFRGLGLETDEADWTSDERVGYLIVEDKVYVAAASTADEAIVLPMEYQLHQPMSPQAEQEFCEFFGCTRIQIDEFMWGSAIHKLLDHRDKRMLRANHSARVVNAEGYRPSFGNHWEHLLRGAAGDIRNILGILLMLNQPAKYIRTYDTKTKRSLSSKGPKVFMAHSTIELSLNRKPIRQLLTRNKEHGHHASPRWHQVRGHFCQDKTARSGQCDHGGGDWWIEHEPKKWQCLECGGKRWWREYPEGKGDAGRGFVKNEHKVIA